MFIRRHDIRISMHPDQFVVINSKDDAVVERSIKELEYHAQVLDLLGLDRSAKIQIHVGGVYNDKEKSMQRFIDRYNALDDLIKKRLVIENDDTSYTVTDCLRIHFATGIPVLFDYFHHQLNSSEEKMADAFELLSRTWSEKDGIMMVDYSSHHGRGSKRSHAFTIDLRDFTSFLEQSKPFDYDVMLEIKDKEESALAALQAVKKDSRFIKV